MIGLQAKPNPQQLAEIQRLLRDIPGGAKRVLRNSINRTATTARTRIVRAVGRHLTVPQSRLYQRGNARRPVTQRNASAGRQSAHVGVSGGRLPLGLFKPRQHWKKAKGRGRVRSAVSFKIKRQGGRTRVTKRLFVVEFASGYEGIFYRPGRGRTPIVQAFGPSIPWVAEKHQDVRTLIDQDVDAVLSKNLDQQTQVLLTRRGRSGGQSGG